MNPLQLFGVATTISNFESIRRIILRLRAPTSGQYVTNQDAALVKDQNELNQALQNGFETIVLIDSLYHSASLGRARSSVCLPAQFEYLQDGDIISIDTDSRSVRCLYRKQSKHNSFLVTERCNHYCLMCSQPPRRVSDGWILDEISDCLALIDTSTETIGFTGGEPLLDWQKFIQLLSKARKALPETEFHVLTNGRLFAYQEVVNAWANLDDKRLCAAIPIYSSVDVIHDYVVQSASAFEETVMGILRLKDRRQRVELRIVLHAITVPGLVDTCQWICRNLPFVDHVALMGLENTGFALANQKDLWIDPIDYSHSLKRAAGLLSTANINFSIYNHPLCVLPNDLWKYAVKSISDWKNAFLPECSACTKRSICGGFFSTGKPKFSRAVQPILS